MDDVLILGYGYTGQRVAKRFLARGVRVTAATQNSEYLHVPGAEMVGINNHVRLRMLVLYSIPPDGPWDLLAPLLSKVKRVVYLSSTAVYGAATTVDERTPVDPCTRWARARIEAERKIAEGSWSTLILRLATIYSPGRGVRESIRQGKYSLSSNFVSRIHIDGLVTHVEAAMLSDATGAYPKLWRSVCGLNLFSMPARLAASLQRFQTDLSEIGCSTSPLLTLLGNR